MLNICLWKKLLVFSHLTSFWQQIRSATTYSVVSCYCFCAGRYFILYCIALVSLFGAYDWTLSSSSGKFIYVINKSFYIEKKKKVVKTTWQFLCAPSTKIWTRIFEALDSVGQPKQEPWFWRLTKTLKSLRVCNLKKYMYIRDYVVAA